jgi:hypothetical protein
MAPKRQIVHFSYHAQSISLDWADTPQAFTITRPEGEASIYHYPYGSGSVGMLSPIDSIGIQGFSLQIDPATASAKLLLEKINGQSIQLGVSDQANEAQKWIKKANQIVAQGRRYRARQAWRSLILHFLTKR